MVSFSSKIAYFIFIAGAFVALSFAAVNYQTLNTDIYFMLYLLLLFLFLFGIFVGERLSWPLKKIIKTANELADGNVKSRAYVKNNDEVGQLAKALNKIAEKLERNHYEGQKAQQLVAVKVNSIVAPFHETIEALEQKSKNRTMDFHKASELSEKLQFDLLLKEAELVDMKGQMAKLMKRKTKSKNILS